VRSVDGAGGADNVLYNEQLMGCEAASVRSRKQQLTSTITPWPLFDCAAGARDYQRRQVCHAGLNHARGRPRGARWRTRPCKASNGRRRDRATISRASSAIETGWKISRARSTDEGRWKHGSIVIQNYDLRIFQRTDSRLRCLLSPILLQFTMTHDNVPDREPERSQK
jgi:hypothetical protein